MRPIDTMETGLGASKVPRRAEGAQRHNDYSLHLQMAKTELWSCRGHRIGTNSIQIGLLKHPLQSHSVPTKLYLFQRMFQGNTSHIHISRLRIFLYRVCCSLAAFSASR